MCRREVKKARDKLKCGKATDVDLITAEMLRYGGDGVVEWMFII